jgi:hypothetical protein
MAKPLIGYKTMLRSATAVVTATATESGFDIANVHDYKTYLFWKFNALTSPINIDIDLGGSTEDADYLTIINSNLKTLGANVRVFADIFTPPTTPRTALTAVGTDDVWYQTIVAPGAFRYWRVQISHNTPPFGAKPFIGELVLGLKTELPHFLDPAFDPFFDGVKAESSRSVGGHYLASLLQGHSHRGVITFGAAGAPRSAFTSDLNALVDHALLRRPFVFVLDTADADFDTARYLRVPDDDDIARKAVGGSWSQLTFELPVEEAFMEPAS